jgi:hypothetical protein
MYLLEVFFQRILVSQVKLQALSACRKKFWPRPCWFFRHQIQERPTGGWSSTLHLFLFSTRGRVLIENSKFTHMQTVIRYFISTFRGQYSLEDC